MKWETYFSENAKHFVKVVSRNQSRAALLIIKIISFSYRCLLTDSVILYLITP